jgi:hypothetical protein
MSTETHPNPTATNDNAQSAQVAAPAGAHPAKTATTAAAATPKGKPGPKPKAAAPTKAEAKQAEGDRLAHEADVSVRATPAHYPNPHYTREGRLTRQGMEDVIKRGGSVLLGGQLLGSVGALPSEASLVELDENSINNVEAGIAAQEKALQKQRAELDRKRQALASKKGATAPAKK